MIFQMISVILLAMLMILHFTLNVFDFISDFWQQLKLTTELKSDLTGTVDLDRNRISGDFSNILFCS